MGLATINISTPSDSSRAKTARCTFPPEKRSDREVRIRRLNIVLFLLDSARYAA